MRHLRDIAIFLNVPVLGFFIMWTISGLVTSSLPGFSISALVVVYLAFNLHYLTGHAHIASDGAPAGPFLRSEKMRNFLIPATAIALLLQVLRVPGTVYFDDVWSYVEYYGVLIFLALNLYHLLMPPARDNTPDTAVAEDAEITVLCRDIAIPFNLVVLLPFAMWSISNLITKKPSADFGTSVVIAVLLILNFYYLTNNRFDNEPNGRLARWRRITKTTSPPSAEPVSTGERARMRMLRAFLIVAILVAMALAFGLIRNYDVLPVKPPSFGLYAALAFLIINAVYLVRQAPKRDQPSMTAPQTEDPETHGKTGELTPGQRAAIAAKVMEDAKNKIFTKKDALQPASPPDPEVRERIAAQQAEEAKREATAAQVLKDAKARFFPKRDGIYKSDPLD